MGREEIESTVINFVRDVIGNRDVRPDTSLLRNRNMIDSISVVRLVHKIEEHFDISFEDDVDLDFLTDVCSLVDAIESKLKNK